MHFLILWAIESWFKSPSQFVGWKCTHFNSEWNKNTQFFRAQLTKGIYFGPCYYVSCMCEKINCINGHAMGPVSVLGHFSAFSSPTPYEHCLDRSFTDLFCICRNSENSKSLKWIEKFTNFLIFLPLWRRAQVLLRLSFQFDPTIS